MNKNQLNHQNANHPSVTIGNQDWMAENLNVDTFRNGDSIPHAETDEEWKAAGEQGKPAWCHYGNDPENGKKYGKLYNWYAVNDIRGLAPKGWRIPTDLDWKVLTDFLSGNDVAAKKLKAKSGWVNCGQGNEIVSCNGTDDFGFSALPAGSRNCHNGIFCNIGEYCEWWSSTEVDATYAWCRSLILNIDDINRLHYFKGLGFSVRCLKGSGL